MVVKAFSGAKTKCMEHYVVPYLEQKPENIIIHVGTNDLQCTDTASKIAGRIMNLALKCSQHSKVFVSGIVKRGDNLNGKGESVNDILQKSCISRNIPFIANNNIELSDLNGSQLHLNKTGTLKLTSNFLEFISKV